MGGALAFDDAVSYTQHGHGLQQGKCYGNDGTHIPVTRVTTRSLNKLSYVSSLPLPPVRRL